MKIKLTKIFFTTLLFLTLSNVYGQNTLSNVSIQDTSKRIFSRSVGIDAAFVNNFLPFDNPIGSRGSHLFHFIKYKKENKFTRQALDINVFGSFLNRESDTDVVDTRFDIDYKVSKGKRKNIFKKGYLLYGPEILFGYLLNHRLTRDPNAFNITSKNKNIDHTFSAAVGPFVGLEYKITKRLSIYAEAGAYLNFTYLISSFKSELNPSLDFNDKRITISNSFNLPRSIILFYHF